MSEAPEVLEWLEAAIRKRVNDAADAKIVGFPLRKRFEAAADQCTPAGANRPGDHAEP